MPVTTAEAFLRVITKSKLLSAEQIEAAREEFGSENDPKAVARKLVKDGAINKWQALQLLGGRSALVIGNYKLLDQIDADEIRRVYLAEHAQMGRRVAVATLSRQHTSENPEAVADFLNRARKLAALDHRNIVHVYDVDSQDDRYYVVMERVQGRNLQELLDEPAVLPLEKVIRYVRQAASGLAYAHNQKLIHGALRPTNLLIDSQDDVKIANFGATGIAISKQDDTATASVDYISPEQAEGESRADTRSDIYSLGCVMYALLTGHPPFTAGSADERRQMHRTEQPPEVSNDRPDAPEELVAICDKMMAKDPTDRFRTAREVYEQLDSWSGEKSESKPVVPPSEADGGDKTDIAESKPAPPKAAAAPPRRKPQEKPASDRRPGKAADEEASQAPETRQAKPRPKTDQPAKSPPPKKPVAEKGKPTPAQPAADKSKPTPKQAKPTAPSPRQQIIADAPGKSPKPPAPAAKGKKPAEPAAKRGGEETKAKPAAAAAGGFAIDTKRRRRRKKGGSAPVVDGAETNAVPSGGKAGIPTIAYVIGAAVGGLVLVAGAILLVVFLFFGGDGEEVALAGDEEASAESVGGVDVTDAGSDAKGEPEDDPAVDAEMDPEEDPVFEEESDPVPASDGDSTPDTATSDSGTEPSENSATPKPADAPKAAAGADKKKNVTKTKSDTGSSATGTPESPAEKKPTEKPKPKKPAAKKKAAKPAKKPFADLKKQKYVPLPDLAATNATEATILGSVYVPSDELCFIKLRGGEDAFKGSQVFAMRNADGGLAERDWEVFLREGESSPGTKIAHMSLNDKSQLSFQWQPEAKTQQVSSYLTNCAFSLSCSGESHIALLRKPAQVEGMALDLEKPSVKQDWDIDTLPDPSAVQVELAAVQGAKHTVDPAPRMDADKGELWVNLEDAGGLSLKIETSLKKSLQLTVTPHVKLTKEAKPEKLNMRNVQRIKKQLEGEVQRWQFMMQQLQNMTRGKKKDDPNVRKIAPRLALAKHELETRQTAVANMDKLEQTVKNLSGKLVLNFRVLYDADSSEVDLLRIGG